VSMETSKNMEIVYGNRSGELIFIPKDLAEDLVKVHIASETSKTWGEFKANAPDRIYEEAIALLSDEEDPEVLPQPEDIFDSASIPGYADGDWPLWPRQYMLEWVPKDIQVRFGRIMDTVLNGEYLQFDPEDTQEIVELLEKHGYSCSEDVALVESAHG
jgi:hypothetical protein